MRLHQLPIKRLVLMIHNYKPEEGHLGVSMRTNSSAMKSVAQHHDFRYPGPSLSLVQNLTEPFEPPGAGNLQQSFGMQGCFCCSYVCLSASVIVTHKCDGECFLVVIQSNFVLLVVAQTAKLNS